MIIVQRENKQLTISEQALPQFLGMGYSQIDEDGNIIKQGNATTVGDLKAENTSLKAEIEKLRSQKEALEKENISLKAEIEAANTDDKKSKK